MGCSDGTTLLSPTTTSQSVNSSPSVQGTPIPKAKQLKSELTPSPTPSAKKNIPVYENHTISAEGIGAAKLGMTFRQLKKVLGSDAEYQVKSPFMVDEDALAVSQAGKVQYYILYPAGTTFTDSQVIQSVMTDNPNYRTVQGVGPGTPLKKAETVYGNATLFYNTENESREFVKFASLPAHNIAFRLQAPDKGQFAGIYTQSNNSYHETKEYNENADIGLVLVLCQDGSCHSQKH